MQYMILIYQGTTPTPDNPEAWEKLSPEEQGKVFQAYGALQQIPGYQPGNPMAAPEMATTVRVEDGRTLTTDGPFAELKDAVGGYFTIDVEDLDAAIEAAAIVPAASMGGWVEIRPARQGY